MKNPLHHFSVGLVLIGAVCLSTLVLVTEAYPATPCCEIVAFDPGNGLVTVKEIATGVTFQFKANSAKLLKSFKVGQAIDTKALATAGGLGGKPHCKCGKRADGTCWCTNKKGDACYNPLCPSTNFDPGGKGSAPSVLTPSDSSPSTR